MPVRDIIPLIAHLYKTPAFNSPSHLPLAQKISSILMALPVPPVATAAILYGPRDIRVHDRSIWAPYAGDVQVQVVATGLCGSDVHYFSDGRNGDFGLLAPLVLGHEASGIVTAVGPGVSGFTGGQRVALEA